METREKWMKIRERALEEAYDIACKPCPLTTCDIEMLGELVDIAKDVYEASKTAMEAAVLAENAAAKKCMLNPYTSHESVK